MATVTPRKPRATFRAYHPDLWIKNDGARSSLPFRPFSRGERKMIHGPYADSTRRPLLPSLDHLFISNILEGKEGNQLIRVRLIVFPFLPFRILSFVLDQLKKYSVLISSEYNPEAGTCSSRLATRGLQARGHTLISFWNSKRSLRWHRS